MNRVMMGWQFVLGLFASFVFVGSDTIKNAQIKREKLKDAMLELRKFLLAMIKQW